MHAFGPRYFRRYNRLHGDRTEEIVARPIREKAENRLNGLNRWVSETQLAIRPFDFVPELPLDPEVNLLRHFQSQLTAALALSVSLERQTRTSIWYFISFSIPSFPSFPSFRYN
jgi:hypothetical protein